jgi:8-oxo-dGTP diphosphatase
MPKKLIMAAGGILQRDGEILLVQRPRYQDWSLPKGKLDRGETAIQAALREVHEETGYRAKAIGFAGAFGYEVKGAPKVVLYWMMKPLKQGPILDPAEVCELKWVTPRRAIRLMTYERERELIKQVFGATGR